MKWRENMKGIDYLEETSNLLNQKREEFIKTNDETLKNVLSNHFKMSNK